MVAKLQPGRDVEGFTEGKEYDYYDQYDIGEGLLTFHIKKDDNGKPRQFSNRQFTINFWSVNKKIK